MHPESYIAGEIRCAGCGTIDDYPHECEVCRTPANPNVIDYVRLWPWGQPWAMPAPLTLAVEIKNYLDWVASL